MATQAMAASMGRLKNAVASFSKLEAKAQLLVMAFLSSLFGEGFDTFDTRSSTFNAAAEGVVQTIIAVGVMVAVGILVLVVIYDATSDVSSDANESPLDGTLDSFFGHLDTVFILVAVALIMLVIGIVIRTLNRSM